MPYRIDGIVHHIGVKTEQALVTLFNQAPPACIQTAYPGMELTFLHKGGTRGVDDIEIHAESQRISGISVKHHGKSGGTFDYINTSKVTDFLPSASGLVETIATLKTQHRERPEAVPGVRKAIEGGVDALWTGLTSVDIHALLKRANERNSEWMCVQASDNCVIVNHNKLEELAVHPYDDSVVYELRAPKSAKSSRQVWRIKDGVATNTHLRLRMVLNNGVGALLALPTAKSKTSILTIKLQQDNVDGLLKQVVLA
jgi:hypothetical protein